MAAGGKGVISVSANIVPGKIAALCKACLDENYSKAREFHYDLFNLNEIMFIETNPVPVKTSLYLMGKVRNEFRLPLTPLNDSNLVKLKNLLKKLKII